MTTSPMADTARLIAKLLANSHTPPEQIPDLIQNVHFALAHLDDAPETAPPRAVTPTMRRTHRPRAAAIASDAEILTEVEAEPESIAPQQPKLVRRAEMISVTPTATPASSLFAAPPTHTVRGVVQWFDTRTGSGTLRLPGFSNDVPVESEKLTEWGITRLYKGQEIEATVATTGDSPRLLRLAQPGATLPSITVGGTVRDRHDKTVMVEMKREGLRREAARAEAELLLRPLRTP